MSNEDTTQNLPEGFNLILSRLDSFEQKVESRLDSFEQKVESRLDSFEQKVLSRLDGFESRLDRFESRLDGFDLRLNGFESRLTTFEQSVKAQLDTLGARLDGVESRLAALEQKVEERLYDTRPLWEVVQADIKQLQEGQRRIESEIRRMRTGFGRTYTEFLMAQEDQEERISQIEKKLE